MNGAEPRLSLYERIGAGFIAEAITAFYNRAFVDPIIGHFFFGLDHPHLIAMQTAFATSMLGGPRTYRGKPLAPLHDELRIRNAHFNRRQVLMAEVLSELGLNDELKSAWLRLEDQLRSLIVADSSSPSCSS